MHTSVQLKAGLFDIRDRGVGVPLARLLSDWTVHDRVGVIVDEPFGLLGASLLVQAAITRYFDFRRENKPFFEALLDGEGERRSLQGIPKGLGSDPASRVDAAGVASPGYADIYALHVGRGHGDHSGMDIWPDNRERVVRRDVHAIATMIADLGITRLLVPDAPRMDCEIDWETRAVLRERIIQVFAYGSGGRVIDPDVEIRGTSPVAEQNPDMVLSMRESVASVEASGATRNPEGTARTLKLMKARLDEVPEEIRLRLVRERAWARAGGTRVETFRHVSLQEGLEILAGAASPGFLRQCGNPPAMS